MKKNYEAITAPKKNVGIVLRHLQKRSLLQKTFIFALQKSIKQLSLSEIFCQKSFKLQTKQAAIRYGKALNRP